MNVSADAGLELIDALEAIQIEKLGLQCAEKAPHSAIVLKHRYIQYLLR